MGTPPASGSLDQMRNVQRSARRDGTDAIGKISLEEEAK